jgi:hypothetical protein
MFITNIIFLLSHVLPPINNVYSGNINLFILGKQNIVFKRIEKTTSEITLDGFICKKGYIYNIEDIKNYKLDNNLQNIINKYKCVIENPIYNNENDKVIFVLKIKLLKITKKIQLTNIDNNLDKNNFILK